MHYRYATVKGRQLFYREAGAPDAPAIVLLHGFPTSSYMFRNLIPALARRYHVIAPDHLGFGHSDAPSAEEFDYTFDALTDADRRPAGRTRRRPVRHLRPGLRRPHRLAPRHRQPGRDHRDRHPERQRLRRRLRTELLEDRVGLPPRADSRDRGRRARRADAGRDPVAVPDRRARPEPGRPGRLPTTTSRWSPGPATTRCSWRCSSTTAPIPRSTQPCTPTCANTSRRCWRSGAVATRSSDRTAPARSPTTCRRREIHLLDGGHFLLESAAEEVGQLMVDFLGEALRVKIRANPDVPVAGSG